MFDNIKQPDDIFAETDKSAPQPTPPTAPSESGPSALSYRAIPPPAGESRDLSTRPAELASVEMTKGSSFKTIMIILAIIVVIGAAFFISWRILSSRTPVTPEAPVEEVGEAIESEDKKITPIVMPEPELAPEPIVEVDTDKDGLLDSKETELGTSVLASDTDSDGLFDREEVEVYMTDPLNPDTDGDTYLDGNEVKAGYNPKGQGKLVEIPSGS